MRWMRRFQLELGYQTLFAKVSVSLVIILLCGVTLAKGTGSSVSYILENGLMKISNAYYEVALGATHGGIAYILDKSSNKNIIEGDASSNLWSANLDKDGPIF